MRSPALSLFLVMLLSQPAGAQLGDFFGGKEFSVNLGPSVECAPTLKLMAADGVPDGNKHSYRFQGICKLLQVGKTSSGKTYKQVGEVWTVAKISWNKSTGAFMEAMTVKGTQNNKSVEGTIQFTLTCAEDPVINPPSCVRGQMDNKSGWAGFEQVYLAARPIAGKTTLAQATAMSQQPGKDSTPPGQLATVPPPMKKPVPLKSAKDSQSGRLPMTTSNVAVTRTATEEIQAGETQQTHEQKEIQLTRGARIYFANGRMLAARSDSGQARWAILGADAAVLRVFPAGSKAYRDKGEVYVNYGGGVTRLGTEQQKVGKAQ